ncbi:hypothetical protein L6452_26326 [Arctium lappa]|uniref:Uncharacterized protein n=1 Tax=Arctium lappa TaxID=4217 RepID=A0ACB9ACV7_ARCLA|nr:hypothetical protein L6452_26326 [Arctium lappa]
MEAKPTEGKIYVPPLILESKISELENTLEEERILIGLEQMVFSTVFINTDFFKTSKAPITNDDDVLFDEEFDFLNSNGCFDKYVEQFDFNAKLPDNSQFIVNSNGLPSVYEKDLKKRKPEVKPEWRPKKKIDETTKSFFDSECCSKHMTRQKDILFNYTEKFCGNVRFGNDQFSPILGYGNVVQENLTIKKVSYVEGLGHNLFIIGQFCDKYLEVNFKAKRCCVRTEDGKELLVGTRKSNLYTINLSNIKNNNVVCLLSKASMQQSWLWHRRLSHLNFRYINMLVTGNLVKGLSELKYVKEHLCDACEKAKDETPDVIISFLNTVQLNLHKTVKLFRTDNGTKFKNKTVDDYLESVGITHQFYAARTPEQNGENSNKFSPKADEGIFIGYSQTSAAYRVYLKKSKIFVESVNVSFDEEMAFDQLSSEPVITGVLASRQIKPEVAQSVGCTAIPTQQTSNVQSTKSSAPVTSTEPLQEEHTGYRDDQHDQSTSIPLPHVHKWIKEHPVHQVIGDPSKRVQTRSATANECIFYSFLSKIEPTRVSEALKDPDWITAM